MKATRIIYSSSIEEEEVETSKIEIELQGYNTAESIALFNKIKILLLNENYHNEKPKVLKVAKEVQDIVERNNKLVGKTAEKPSKYTGEKYENI